MKQKLLITLLVSTGFWSTLQAQDIDSLYSLSLEELMNITVTTASKQEESLRDAAAVVSVISNTEIESYGALSLGEILDRATNTYMASGYTYRDNMLSIRGNATADVNTNVLVLIDGRPFRESLTNGLSASAYMSFPVDRIDRIEIIRGPGSVLYGACAITGVINIITKSVSKSPLSASFRYGTFNTLQGSLSGGKQIGKLKLTGGINLWNTDGWEFKTLGQPFSFLNPNTGQVGFLNPDPDSAKLYKNNIGANVGAKLGNFKLSANYLKSKQANMGVEPFWFNFIQQPGAPPYNSEFYTDISRVMVDLGYEKSISDAWKTSFNITNNFLDLDKRYDAFPNFRDEGSSRDILAEFTNYLSPVKNLNMIVGGLLNYQTGDYFTYTKQGETDVNFNAEKNTTPLELMDYDELWWSVYAQADYKLHQNLKLVSGFQANKVTDLDIDVVPRVGAILNLTENAGFKVLYGKAFRSPSQYERNARNIPEIINNPELKPEKIGTFETQLFFNRKKFEAYLTYYNSKQTNVIRLGSEELAVQNVTIDVPQYVNGGTLNSYGFELEGKALITPAFSFNFSTSYQHTEDEEEKKDIFGMPQFMGKLGIQYTSSGFTAGIFNSYFGKGEDVLLEPSNKINPEASGYNYLSVNLQYDLAKLMDSAHNLLIGFYVTNLLDEDVYYAEYTNRTINTLPGRGGRSLYGSIKYRF